MKSLWTLISKCLNSVKCKYVDLGLLELNFDFTVCLSEMLIFDMFTTVTLCVADTWFSIDI